MRAEGIYKHYDGVQALRGAKFSVECGEVHALMGENGAGKSTLAKVIAGSVKADAGTITGGPRVEMIYQELDLFPHLSVAENIAIGRKVRFRDWVLFAQPFLDRVGLTVSPRALVESLRAGERQLVAIARALASDARFLIMDEPTSSLFDDAVERLFRLIGELKRSGVGIVYVSHRMKEIFQICDRATVLRDGMTVGTKVVAETSAEELIRMMVGREIRQAEAPVPPGTETVLRVDGLSTEKLSEVSFEVRKGEVLGIAGLVGAGRSEIGAALFGLDRRTSGEIVLNGREVAPGSPADAIRLGIALLPEDRKREGLMMQMSVADNAALGRSTQFGLIDRAEENAALDWIFRGLALKAASMEAAVSTLSGGNQQKVLLARCLLAKPKVLFLDDPTRGIDVGAKEEIYAVIERLKAEGKGVILVSSELPELLRCSDRILVMREGRATATMGAEDATEERIMKAATL